MSLAEPYRSYGALAVALSACGGGVGLATGGLSLGREIDARLPFESPVFGGVALIVLVALPFAALAWFTARGHLFADVASITAGLTLIAWLIVELAFIRELSFLHPLLGSVGVAFVLSGRRAVRSRT